MARLYAATHPRRVAGLVMVDALSEFIEDGYTREQMVAFDDLNNGPLSGLESYTDLEQVLFRPSFRQMRRAARARPLGDIPYGVISRRLPIELPPGLPAGLTTKLSERVWRQSQRRLARLVPGTRRTIAARSSHYVMFTQPGLIIHEVRRVVRLARGLQSSPR
jgi:pimeloyl-ACP methyl ester carboxylesterase